MELDCVRFKDDGSLDPVFVAMVRELGQLWIENVQEFYDLRRRDSWNPRKPAVEFAVLFVSHPHLADSVKDPDGATKSRNQSVGARDQTPLSKLGSKDQMASAEPFDDSIEDVFTRA